MVLDGLSAASLRRLSCAAVESAARRSGAPIGVALVYHSIAPVGGDPSRELVPPHGIRVFEAQLRFLAERYRVVTASELLDAATSRKRGAPLPVAISFDDDLASHFRWAKPVLLEVGQRATFFLSGASLEAPFCFWWERLQRAFDADSSQAATIAECPPSTSSIHVLGRRFEEMAPAARDRASHRLLQLVGPDPPDAGLRREQVAGLHDSGFDIGFHTLRHDRLPDLPDPHLAAAMTTGRQELAEIIGAEPSVIAYPHGEADERVASAAAHARFKNGFTGVPGPVTSRSDPLLLGRIVPSLRSVGGLRSQLARAQLAGFVRRA
jgi:peptidoglycan/xylan/chitin deacetylase (PgdA/CDA1 family)